MSTTHPCCNWHATGGSFLMACNSGLVDASLSLSPLAPSPTVRTYEQGVADGRAAAAVEARAAAEARAETERKAKAFDEVRRLWWEFSDVEEGKAALRCLGEFIGEWEHHAERREAIRGAAEVVAERALATYFATVAGPVYASVEDLKAAEVNHGQREEGAQAQPAGAAAAPTGQAGGEQSSPAGPPAGSRYCTGAEFLAAAQAVIEPRTDDEILEEIADAGPLVSSMPIRQWPARLVPGPITVVNESTAPGIDFLSFSVLPVQGAGKELLRVPAGVTPAELRQAGFPDVAAGFPDVAARLEGKPAYEPARAIDPEGHCCRWHASGGSREAACSDGAARPYSPRGP